MKRTTKGTKATLGKAFASIVFVSFVFFVVLFIRVHSVFNPWQIGQVIFARILSERPLSAGRWRFGADAWSQNRNRHHEHQR